MTTPRRWPLYHGHLSLRCYRRPGRSHPTCPECFRVVVHAELRINDGPGGGDAQPS